MSVYGFDRCDAVTMLPENDGQDFHDTPDDPGGATRYAVTFKTFVAWRTAHGLPHPTSQDFRTAHVEELQLLRHAGFWTPCNLLPIGIDLIGYEIAIGSGPAWRARLLRRALGLCTGDDIDGQVLSEVNRMRPVQLIPLYNKAHWNYVKSLNGAHRFGAGWDRRITEDGAFALRWATGGVTD